MTITAEQEAGSQPAWVEKIKVKELSGKHAGMVISLGREGGTSLGWSWTVGGVLLGVTHSVKMLNPNGTRDLNKSRVRVMLRTEPEQEIGVVADPDDECEVSYGTNPGRLHHGITEK